MVPSVRVMPLKALSFAGRGRASRVAAAIYYAADQGAKVINLSLGGSGISKAEAAAIDYASSKGVVVVAAAGNAGRDVASVGPAGLPNVITVGASDPDDAVASFSNTGARIDLWRPARTSSRCARGDRRRAHRRARGLPGGHGLRRARRALLPRERHILRGALRLGRGGAYCLASNPSLTPEEVKRILLQSAKDIGAPGIDQKSGYGRLDLKAALTADPKTYVDARIEKVAVTHKGDAQIVVVTGTVDADLLSGGEVELGAGDNPNPGSPWARSRRV